MTAPRPFAEIVEELTRLDAAATPGPWRVSRVGDEPHMRIESETQGLQITAYLNSIPAQGANMALIAAMRNALPLLLSRLASREAVFEAAVAWADEPFYPRSQENYHVQMMRHSARAKALRAAIDAARALDAATPQGEEGK